MLLIAKGKEKAFDELYKRYSKRILFFFYQRLYQDKEKSQDFLQDLFLKIIEKPEVFNADKKFSTWIYAMASNMCKNEYRRNGVRKLHIENLDLSSFDDKQPLVEFSDKHDGNLFLNHLNIELENLDENQRLTFVLRYQEHLSIKEISEIMECSEGTVKSRLFYTTKKLADRLRAFNI